MVDVLYANEEIGEYPQSYYAASAELLPPFSALNGRRRADVCVIGGGYSGLSAALHLRRRGYDVALLDAHRVGWGASGRNGGQVASGQNADPKKLVKEFGIDDARRLWRLAEDAKALVAQLIDEYKIDCDPKRGILYVDHKASYSDETKELVDFLNEKFGYSETCFVPKNELRSILATQAYHSAAYDLGGFHLHPLRLALGLARTCDQIGVEIFERSHVVRITEGEKLCVKTRDGEICADHVILAVNGYTGNLNPYIANRVMPINSFMIATEPLADETKNALIANDAAVTDSKFVVSYFRISGDNRLLFGGRESYRYRFPADIKSYVQKAMLRVYPQLREAKIDYGWGGVVGLTMNRLPHFKWLSPRMLTIGGYSGHGVALATLGGALAAEAIAGVSERFSLMEKTPTHPFPGGAAARLPLLALGMAYYSLKDRL